MKGSSYPLSKSYLNDNRNRSCSRYEDVLRGRPHLHCFYGGLSDYLQLQYDYVAHCSLDVSGVDLQGIVLLCLQVTRSRLFSAIGIE